LQECRRVDPRRTAGGKRTAHEEKSPCTMADTDTPLKSVNPSCTGLSPGAARHHRHLAVSSRRIFKSGSGWSSVSRILIVCERHAAWPDKPFEGKKTYAPSCSSEPYWQEDAGGLLLVAAESRDKVALTLGNGDTPSVNCCSLTRAVSCSGLSSQIVAHPAPAERGGLAPDKRAARVYRRRTWASDGKTSSVRLLAYRAVSHPGG
jgi:hypothetical protein